MRQHGSRATAGGLGVNDHGCLVYTAHEELVTAGLAYLRDGVALGQRPMYVGDVALPGLDDDVEHVRLEQIYGVDPGRFYGDAIDRALADGYTGLRTLAEATPLLLHPHDPERMAAWEAQADRMMAERPWSALCCYDRRQVGERVLCDIASLHPVGCETDDLTGFHLYCPEPGRLALSGEVEYFQAADLERLLEVVPGAPVDLSTAAFLDHNAVLALSRAGVRVENAPYAARRAAEVLGVQL